MLDHDKTFGKIYDLKRTVILALPVIVNPNLGSVYEFQFRVMEEPLGVMEKNYDVLKQITMKAHDQIEQVIVLKNTRAIELMPMACASCTGQPMQIQVNIPLK